MVVSALAIVGFLGSVMFTTQGGLFWLDIVDHFLTQYGLVLGGILECILVAWVYKAYKLREYINKFSRLRLHASWDYTIKLIIPAVLSVIVVNSLFQEFASPYEGYPWLAIVLIGRDWVIFTLFLAVIVATRRWKQYTKKDES
jgi:NSS family neurotransmitter:Na+ symporter